MSKDYIESKIREAMLLHGDNTAHIRKKVMRLAYEDSKLMSALARPHLEGIIAYQVERVMSGRSMPVVTKDELSQEKHKAEETGADFGMRLLRAVASREVTVFGQENTAAPKRKGASQQHVDAIYKMVSSRDKNT